MAVREVGIGLNALFWSLFFGVVELVLVDIFGCLFGGLNIKIIKETSSFPHTSYVARADVGPAVSWLFALVLPVVNFLHGDDVFKSKISGRSLCYKLFNAETIGAKSVVKSLVEEDINCLWVDRLKNREDNRKDVWGKNGWKVILWSIEP